MADRPVTTGQSEFATARLPSGNEDAIVADSGDPRQPHEVLGVDPDAPPEVVKGAARQLMKKHHPDQGGDVAEYKAVVRAQEAMLDE
jgi:DnaJ-domain-containing protein 1